MKNIAVILAAGSGSRAGEGLPKQFRRLPSGKTVIETTIDAFERNELIDSILVVLAKTDAFFWEEIRQRNDWKKVLQTVEGGSERWESSWHAVSAVRNLFPPEDGDCNVLLHDAARTFVSQQIINRVCEALQTNEAVSVAVPMTDTVYTFQAGEDGNVLTFIPPRGSLCRAQTPQAFRVPVIYEAYRQALQSEEGLRATDDCGIVREQMPQVSILLVQGEEKNRKLTYAEDFTD